MKRYGCEVTTLTFAVSVLHFSAFIIIVIIKYDIVLLYKNCDFLNHRLGKTFILSIHDELKLY